MSDIISNLGYLAGATRFRRISEKLYVDGDKIYKNSGLEFKASWFSVFYTLATRGEQTILELADAIGFTHITVKNIVIELEKNSLVTIKPNPADKRSKKVALSPGGKRLFKKLEKVWIPFEMALKELLDRGHPDFLNMITRIDDEISKHPVHQQKKRSPVIKILDYKPSLKGIFNEMAGNWLLGVLDGVLEKEDVFTLNDPEKAYLETGGFLFFAVRENKAVACVALKRLNEHTFEFAKLFVDPAARNLGIATRLIERCITRCKENDATQLWLQTTMSMPEAHKLYYKLGFKDRKAPKQMDVLKRTQKVMVKEL